MSFITGGQSGWAQLPEGWALAPNTVHSQVVIGMYPFGCLYVFLSDGSAFRTNVWTGSAGQQAWGLSSFFIINDRGIAFGNRERATNSRILMVSQSCSVGFYGYNGTCHVCDNSIPVEAYYVSTAIVNDCAWDCNPGLYVSGLDCHPCSNPIPQYAYYSSAGIPRGADNCDWACNSGFIQEEFFCSPCENTKPNNAIYSSSGDPISRTCPWACDVGFHLEQGICIGGQILKNGNRYATLDGADPRSEISGCQGIFLILPKSWQLASNSPSSIEVVASYPWSADFLVLGDGAAIYTGRNQANKGASAWWQYSSLLHNGSMIKPAACNGRILIQSLNCDSGYFFSRNGCELCNISECGAGFFRKPCSQGKFCLLCNLDLDIR
jgi:hypothetical protein